MKNACMKSFLLAPTIPAHVSPVCGAGVMYQPLHTGRHSGLVLILMEPHPGAAKPTLNTPAMLIADNSSIIQLIFNAKQQLPSPWPACYTHTQSSF